MAKNVYDEDFKRSIISLYQNGKTQTQLSKDYGISLNVINKWVKQYPEIKTEDGDAFTHILLLLFFILRIHYFI